jgi:hypothetical protein
MISVLFYGNCQTSFIESMLNLDKTKYITTCIHCWETEIDKKYFINAYFLL